MKLIALTLVSIILFSTDVFAVPSNWSNCGVTTTIDKYILKTNVGSHGGDYILPSGHFMRTFALCKKLSTVKNWNQELKKMDSGPKNFPTINELKPIKDATELSAFLKSGGISVLHFKEFEKAVLDYLNMVDPTPAKTKILNAEIFGASSKEGTVVLMPFNDKDTQYMALMLLLKDNKHTF